MRNLFLCLAIVSAAWLAGCHKTTPRAEIEAAIQNHLKQNSHLMLNSFSTQFEKITINGDAADALVEYQSKNVPNLAVKVRYGLKKINGQWQVISSSSAGGQMANPANPHAGATLDQAPPPQGPLSPVPSH